MSSKRLRMFGLVMATTVGLTACQLYFGEDDASSTDSGWGSGSDDYYGPDAPGGDWYPDAGDGSGSSWYPDASGSGWWPDAAIVPDAGNGHGHGHGHGNCPQC
jgi:hypothetical protein